LQREPCVEDSYRIVPGTARDGVQRKWIAPKKCGRGAAQTWLLSPKRLCEFGRRRRVLFEELAVSASMRVSRCGVFGRRRRGVRLRTGSSMYRRKSGAGKDVPGSRGERQFRGGSRNGANRGRLSRIAEASEWNLEPARVSKSSLLVQAAYAAMGPS
jgi:hypothetical protein